MAGHQEYVDDLYAARNTARRQLANFDNGMRILMNGADRTEFHINALKKMVKSYDKLLEALGA